MTCNAVDSAGVHAQRREPVALFCVCVSRAGAHTCADRPRVGDLRAEATRVAGPGMSCAAPARPHARTRVGVLRVWAEGAAHTPAQYAL